MKPLPFKHSVALDSLSLTSVLMPILHHYRTGLDQAVLADRIQLELELAYRADADAVWNAVPSDGQYGFMKCAARVSLQIQKAMRCWLQMYWFANPENFVNTAKSSQLLTYLACRPYHPKAKNAYAYDPLDDWSMTSMERSIRGDLPDSLSRAAGLLRILGKHDLADFYLPTHATWFLEETNRDGKFFFEILAREARIINAWAPHIGQPMGPDRLRKSREATAAALQGLFRRGDPLAHLAPIFEIEAVGALDLQIGRPDSRSLVLTGNPERSPEAAALSHVMPISAPRHRFRRSGELAIPFSLIDDEQAA
ncbi:hypothetical protein [Bryobacter aggregatus]|uniref:hypothetical protein n=1 Tax=Bryobacter aggregatus TaxID=360054 RepID=UPI0012BA9AEA|nr:hypothetical protein [Bryobacter aggregatus]